MLYKKFELLEISRENYMFYKIINNIMKIWVIRVGWLWDAIVFSPFLKELRKQYPNDEITLFVQHNSSWEYFQRLKYYDKLEYVDRKSSFVTKIKYFFKFFKRYDLVIDTINGWRLSCIMANIFWKKTIWFYTFWKYSINIRENEYNRSDFRPIQDLTILKKLKNIDVNKVKIKLDFPLFNKDFMKTKIYSNFCIFHTWWSSQTTWSYSKNLSIKQIESIISFIIDAWYTCIVVWKKDDKEILKVKDRNNLIKITDINIRELWALIKKSHMYIWWNSWPMRIAMALNKKSITISSASDKSFQPLNKYFPNVKNIISSYNNCSMCWSPICKYNKDKTLQWLCIKNLDLNQIKNFILNRYSWL
jgi:ADP-heptose:LPS heptosyltransferase